MAFGLKREELSQWKQNVRAGKIDFITHYWLDDRFPDCNTVTKVGCSDLKKLKEWGRKYNLDESWIDLKPEYPHFDLFGDYQREILKSENRLEQLERFK
ncbi:hypothetical protein [Oceanobacillus sp. CFH 90083]|uniref:hypothetical protein n=1 Tax=Oceanobacillus sp. CFH 90083 TaxID=2592336 RepID=UPI00128D750A|nr:hypothetical protein [Oceanobacillus sp. CFH 90083]